MIGETIGHFEITARVGRGGMGEVFLAEHTAIKTRVAIKILHAEVSTNTQQVQRFFNEARAVARIQHAGIVKMFDVGFHADHRAYLIMEYLEGETLAERIERTGRLSAHSTAELARQIASVLGATHHAGIIHRDLKPENVFLVHDREHRSGERVKLLDFGIAKLTDAIASANPTTAGAMGTPTYMAPEQWSDSSRVDWRADVYSLGCLLYKMAVGRPPFTTNSIAEACAKHLHETPQAMRAFAPDVPAALDALALRLLAKAPDGRAASIEALEAELADIARAHAGAPEPPPLARSSLADAAPPLVTAVSEPTAIQTPTQAQMTSTTLSSAASIVMPAAPPPRRRARVIVPAALALVGAAIAIDVLATREDAPIAQPAPAPVIDAPPAVDARPALDAPATRTHDFIEWLEAANPFVDWRGARWLAHQVTRREYHKFLETMPVDQALHLQPVTGWNDGEPGRPVAWVTYERAVAFCQAIHARLPTSDEWLAASQGDWGLDPEATGHPGPLQEWTSTENNGLVVVRGGHVHMTAADLRAAVADPLMKNSEAAAGSDPAPKLVAAETIGFRCVR